MNNSHIRLKQSMAVLFFTGLTVLGIGLGTAQAGKDWKTYPGTMCRPADMDSPDVGYFAEGRIYNKNTSSGLLIYCPIVRDMISANAKWTKVVIHYHNPDPAKKIRCDMVTRYSNGRLMNSRRGKGSSSKGILRIYNRSKSGRGVYTLSCSLPPSGSKPGSSGISLIQVHEAD